jgi:signal transduction histidine kinase
MSTSAHERSDRLLALLQRALGHELPNRLIAIQGFVQLLSLEEADHLGAEGKEYLQRLTAATQRTAGLIKALAEFVRSARDSEVAETFTLNEALREAVAEVKQLYPQTNIGYDLTEPGPRVRVSRAAFRRVAVHLLRNACQAAAPTRELRIEVGACESPETVEFWVNDNGRGLTSLQLARLHEPFVGKDGPGLGLTLVRHLVESWGGTVRVQSEPDQGSTFSVSVPKEMADCRLQMAD